MLRKFKIKVYLKCRFAIIVYTFLARAKTLYACEIKFSKQEIGVGVIDEVKRKLVAMHLPRGFSVVPILIHVNGVSDALVDQQYFGHIINFSGLLDS